MPELPEVETTRRGIAPHTTGRTVARVLVRQPRLRWPVPSTLIEQLPGQAIASVGRRGKYLLLETAAGTALVHLGMSGSLRLVEADTPPGTHDHVDIVFADGRALRFRDPRRFGSLLWTTRPSQEHPLLRDLGPEPLDGDFSGDYLSAAASGRSVAVKHFIMNSHVVVGVGNIYACESLFVAGVDPRRPARGLSRARCERLVLAIKLTLRKAIRAGGASLRDFVRSDGEPGHFQLRAWVYGRAGLPCRRCGTPVRRIVQAQRATFYCPRCQR